METTLWTFSILDERGFAALRGILEARFQPETAKRVDVLA